ncbi:MAG: sulfatase-like hydrolase/transferase [Planctomycetota bacterium]|nr:sulfatase-like hydrolase/transferase [Planctomycetota bacterium]
MRSVFRVFFDATRVFLRTTLGFILLFATACEGRESGEVPPSGRPNIILVMADDLGWGDVGFNGNTTIRTPNLDSMAQEGLILNRFYAGAPVCSPTRGSVLTGRHPTRYGIDFANTGHLPLQEFNLAETLRAAGYRTGHFGKWHLGTLTKIGTDANRGGARNQKHYAPPQLRGFDTCFSTESKVPTFDPLVKPENAGGTWWAALESNQKRLAYGTSYWDHNGKKVTSGIEGDDSELIVRKTSEFIEDCVETKKPFLAVVWFHAPHLPVVASEEDRRPYADWDDYAQHYFGCITAMDRAMGQLRETVENQGISDNTLIAFCSDNGPEGQARRDQEDHRRGPGTAAHLRGRKRDLFEGGIRVPAFLLWPGKIAAGQSEVPMSTLDYAPTLIDLLKLPQSPNVNFDGISLNPLLQGKPFQRSQPIVFNSRRQAAVIAGDWKWVSVAAQPFTAVYPKVPQQEEMLFNLREDAAESRNLADQFPNKVAELNVVFSDFMQSATKDRRRHGIK